MDAPQRHEQKIAMISKKACSMQMEV